MPSEVRARTSGGTDGRTVPLLSSSFHEFFSAGGVGDLRRTDRSSAAAWKRAGGINGASADRERDERGTQRRQRWRDPLLLLIKQRGNTKGSEITPDTASLPVQTSVLRR